MTTPDAPSVRRFLALFRAGPSSLHSSMTASLEETSFDFAVSWYGTGAPPADMVDGARFVHLAPEPSKMLGLDHTLRVHWAQIQEYDYVWLADDDLRMTSEDLSEFFETCATLQLDLAQPALSHDSYITHAITAVHPGFQVRFTNFVEVMAPAFSRSLLEQVRPTLRGSLTGWGLDHLWRHFAPLGNIAIVDHAPMTHTRPLGAGTGYDVLSGSDLTVQDDWQRTMLRYGLTNSGHTRVTYGGLLDSGALVTLGDPNTEVVEHLFTHLRDSVAALGHPDAERYLEETLRFVESPQRRFADDLLREKITSLG